MRNYVLLLVCVAFLIENVKAQKNTENKLNIEIKKPSVDRLFKNGFWIDLGAGMATVYEERPTLRTSYFHYGRRTTPAEWQDAYSFTIKFGNKWYYPKHDRYQFGFQMTWLGGGLDLTAGGGFIDIGAFGFCSLFRINDKAGIEANLNVGPSVYITDVGYFGVEANVELKYRVGYFTIGTTFRYFTGNYGGRERPTVLNFLLALGLKF